jgi:short-subunit dehydrogenase
LALLTGASSGIGRELARLFAADGWDLVLVARREEALRALAGELRVRHGVRAHVVPTDLADPAGPARLADEVEARGLAVDALVNNAGMGVRGRFAETDWATERDLLMVNVGALTDLTKRFLPGMLSRGRGRILNLASTAAFQPGPLMAVYFASKAYVLHFSLALADELAGSGVTVTTLCPGPTRTGFADVAGAESTRMFRRGRGDDPARVARIGYRATMAGRRMVVVGWWNRLQVFGTRFAPRSLAAAVARRYAERPGGGQVRAHAD